MKGVGWRSLRTRIILLTIVTCGFLAVAAGSFYSFLRSSYAATVKHAERHLTSVATDLANAYTAQAPRGISLQNTPAHPPRPHGPPPPPPNPGAEGAAHAPPPRPVDPLSKLTASVLQREEGIEGGFLAGNGPLVGYAFPTHEGPGSQKEMPQRERPAIDELAHKAESTGTVQNYSFAGPHDVVLFTAQPVHEQVSGTQRVTGAVWLMQRLPDLNRGRSKQFLLASLGFGAAALVTALLAWFVTVEINGGVSAITHRLALLETDLSQTGQAEVKPQLAEFERVLSGLDAMATSLRRRIANQRRLEDELRHKERLSSLGQFAAGVAHELRNPLATIRLRAQMSQASPPGNPVHRNSSVILEEVDRLDTMIGRLLYFSRPISLNLQSFDLGAFCAAVVASWKDRSPQDVAVSCHLDRKIELTADRDRLLQVLDNIIENAVQASEPVGEVTIHADQHNGSVHIDVTDRGTGMDVNALRHAFDPFFTTKDSGTGLGLSIAFELVQAHGGELTIKANTPRGAVVSIVLPQVAAGGGTVDEQG